MAAPTNLHRDLGRIEGKLDAVIADMRTEISRAHVRLDGHEVEIDALKETNVRRQGVVNAARWLWGFLTAAIGAVAGAFGGGFVR